MTHSSSSSSSNMDHEPTATSIKLEEGGERLILPPISSMDGFFASRSWPPPSTSIPSNNLVSPGSNSSYMSMQETILSPPISRNNNNNEAWSPIPNKSSKDAHPHNQPILDYFTTTTITTINATAAQSTNSSSCSSSSLSPMDRDNIRYQGGDHHYRQNSLPQISSFRKNSINSIISQQPTTTSTINQQSIFRYQPNNNSNTSLSSSSASSLNNINTSTTAASVATPSNNHNFRKIKKTNYNNDSSLELVLSPASLSTPSLRSIEKDIEEVIQHCNSLADNMYQRKSSIVENDNYFSNPTLMRPWLDDMIGRANEVLNALLRLRKHQLAAEYARLHRVPDHQHNRRGAEDNKNWDTSNNTMTPTSGVMSLNSVRLRKRGKRPVFQGRCHSCNISETPEWRRGPDGARTLCNACGLHYAKLAKKKVKQQDDVKKETIEEDRDDTSMK